MVGIYRDRGGMWVVEIGVLGTWRRGVVRRGMTWVRMEGIGLLVI